MVLCNRINIITTGHAYQLSSGKILPFVVNLEYIFKLKFFDFKEVSMKPRGLFMMEDRLIERAG